MVERGITTVDLGEMAPLIKENIPNLSWYLRNHFESNLLQVLTEQLHEHEKIAKEIKARIHEIKSTHTDILKKASKEELSFLKEAKEIRQLKPQNTEPLLKNYNNTFRRSLFKYQFINLLEAVE